MTFSALGQNHTVSTRERTEVYDCGLRCVLCTASNAHCVVYCGVFLCGMRWCAVLCGGIPILRKTGRKKGGKMQKKHDLVTFNACAARDQN